MKRRRPGEAIDWEDYKSMTFTRAVRPRHLQRLFSWRTSGQFEPRSLQVILETLRFLTLQPGIQRRATEDLVINDFLIPKGWKIFVRIDEHLCDPCLSPELHKFSPWRWQVSEYNFLRLGCPKPILAFLSTIFMAG